MSAEAMMPMKRLFGNVFWAGQRFLRPGLYVKSRRIIPILCLSRFGEPVELAKFPEANVVFAADQPEYRPLSARKIPGIEGKIVFCWKLKWHERLRLLFTGRLWHSVLTFNQPLQPQLLEVRKPKL